LEGVTLEALALRGWTLACVESGLDGALLTRLARAEHPAYRGGSSREVQEGALAQAASAVRQEFNTAAVLGVILSISDEQQNIFMVIITPRGQEERHLTYGGHPKNAPRWAVNTALDWLRRIAQKAG
jgi:UDP-N-acetyl-D-mannosaminuronic acid transferase (WecB/TagA/CpsF family)